MALEAPVELRGEEVVGEDVLLRHIPIALRVALLHVLVLGVAAVLIARGDRRAGPFARRAVEPVHRFGLGIIDRVHRFWEPVRPIVRAGHRLGLQRDGIAG